MQQPDFVSLRPNAVRAHVMRIATRMGCNDEQALRCGNDAVKAIREGDTAHRAICSGIRVAAEFTGQPIIPLPPRVETLERHLAPSRAGFALALILMFIAMVAPLSGCSDIKVKVLEQIKQDGKVVALAGEPKMLMCDSCPAPTVENVQAFEVTRDKWVQAHTVTIPVGKCIAADAAMTGIGLATGQFVEVGLALPIKAVMTWWQVQVAEAAARTGDPKPAQVLCVMHGAAAAIDAIEIAAAL
jgi:hypothetical protein